MKKLIIMVGLPGSGKSTYIKENLIDTGKYRIFSSDNYRKNLFGNESDQSNNKLIFTSLYRDLENELKEQEYDCIFDATNTTYKSRVQALQLAKKYNYEAIALVIHQPLSQCIQNDMNRARTVGENVIIKFANSFQFPQYWEGFNDIKIIRPGYNQIIDKKEATNFLEYEMFDILKPKMDCFEQHTPYHNLTVGKHCDVMVNKIIEDYTCNKLSLEEFCKLTPAAMWHDCGKLYTQSFDDNGVAHYYNHEKHSVLKLLDIYSCLNESNYSKDLLYDILFIINNHMHIRDISKSEKSTIKHKQKWGDFKYNLMIKFMEYDNQGKD